MNLPASYALQAMKRTSIESPRLHQIVSSMLGSGHGYRSAPRAQLSWILHRALGIVRRPGRYAINPSNDVFEGWANRELEDAVDDARRIALHTQAQFRAHGVETIALSRGLRGKEAGAALGLLDRLSGDTIPILLASVSFFNHKPGGYGTIRFHHDFPAGWIWACGYTVDQLNNGTDEEFLVVCPNMTGTIDLPRKNVSVESRDSREIEPIEWPQTNCDEALIREVLDTLFVQGLGPDVVESAALVNINGLADPWSRFVARVARALIGKPARLSARERL